MELVLSKKSKLEKMIDSSFKDIEQNIKDNENQITLLKKELGEKNEYIETLKKELDRKSEIIRNNGLIKCIDTTKKTSKEEKENLFFGIGIHKFFKEYYDVRKVILNKLDNTNVNNLRLALYLDKEIKLYCATCDNQVDMKNEIYCSGCGRHICPKKSNKKTCYRSINIRVDPSTDKKETVLQKVIGYNRSNEEDICYPCQNLFGGMQKIIKKYKNNPVSFLVDFGFSKLRKIVRERLPSVSVDLGKDFPHYLFK